MVLSEVASLGMSICTSSRFKTHRRCREGIEDLTGGVTTEIIPTDILDRDWFWTHELMNTGKLYLFGLCQSRGKNNMEKGIYKNHTYTILEARELDNIRLLKVR